MADEKKDTSTAPVTAPATAGAEAPTMTQGKPGETKSSTGADSSSGPKPAAPAGGGFADMLPIIVSMILVFYFLIIRPDKKRREQQLAVMSTMKKGDKVLSSAGFYGTIADMDGDDATVIIDKKNDVRIKVRKESLGLVSEPEEKK